ncbi:disease resistance protein RGA2-like [Ziziphus jujuba]|uniref:Disease resistance protein RGA2-like n=1 Tax=Ziziphus jujuba TaxID=326968 RepID=A0ABM4A2H8_ZIZJJ|nr:disease resistance protein RGA2-like [Ziziphus jujuba]
MAEAILFNIAERILGRLGSAGIEEIGLLWRVNDELQELEKTVSAIKAVLLDAEKQRFHNHQVRNWLERLEEVVYEADDLVDDFSTEALRRRLMHGNKISKQVRTFFSSSNQLGFRSKVGHKIKQVRKKLADIAADRIHLNLEERYEVSSHVVARMRDHTHSFVHDEEVIGRGDDRMAILRLLDAKTEENVSVIPIVGAGGLGKTTVAQLVFNDKNVQQHFEVRLWVCVSDVFDLRLLVEKITKFVVADKVNLEMEQLQKHLREKLNGKRYLLVLDDVWNESREKWLGLKNLLPNDVKGSKIIVTTRSEIVARMVGTMQPYHLKVLDEENSWNLFKQMAFEKEQASKIDSNTMEIGRQIVKKCGGIGNKNNRKHVVW